MRLEAIRKRKRPNLSLILKYLSHPQPPGYLFKNILTRKQFLQKAFMWFHRIAKSILYIGLWIRSASTSGKTKLRTRLSFSIDYIKISVTLEIEKEKPLPFLDLLLRSEQEANIYHFGPRSAARSRLLSQHDPLDADPPHYPRKACWKRRNTFWMPLDSTDSSDTPTKFDQQMEKNSFTTSPHKIYSGSTA